MARRKDAAARFPASYVPTSDGRHRRVRTLVCDRCGYPTRINDNHRDGMPPEVVSKKFQAQGWSINGSAICPRCREGKPPMSPAARRAAFCAINMRGARRMSPQPATKAAPPPLPTVSDRRRIRDALDEHYNEEAGCYRQSWSDRALAGKLDVPPKWVTDVREVGGYGPDENEATAVRAAEIEEVKAEFAKLQADLLERFDQLERKLRKLNPGGDL